MTIGHGSPINMENTFAALETGPLTTNEIVSKIDAPRDSVASALRSLVKRGYVVGKRDPANASKKVWERANGKQYVSVKLSFDKVREHVLRLGESAQLGTLKKSLGAQGGNLSAMRYLVLLERRLPDLSSSDQKIVLKAVALAEKYKIKAAAVLIRPLRDRLWGSHRSDAAKAERNNREAFDKSIDVLTMFADRLESLSIPVISSPDRASYSHRLHAAKKQILMLQRRIMEE